LENWNRSRLSDFTHSLGFAVLFYCCHWLIGLFTHQAQPQPLEAVPPTTLPGQEISPSFSPDGSQVAFGWDGETNGAGFDLYVKVIGTDKPLRLTNHPAPWLGVAWSPDGRNIAVHPLTTEDSGIFLVPALGGRERKLVSTNSSTDWAPDAAISGSPDGKQLAFVDRVPLVGYSTKLFLPSLDPLERKQMDTGCEESGDLWQITLGQSESPEKVPAGHDAASPVISSSGKRLAYVQSRINGNIGPTLGSRATFPQRDFWTAVRGCALSG
jgi:Tol biopolymer transport system component